MDDSGKERKKKKVDKEKSTAMENTGKEKKTKKPKKASETKKNSVAYKLYREKANARKRKFIDKMTQEQKEKKKAQDREYYYKKKAERKVLPISEKPKREQRLQRKRWKQNSQKYRQKQKILKNILANSPPPSDNESHANNPSVQKQRGRKAVKKDRAKAYRTIKKRDKKIQELKKIIKTLKKQIPQENLSTMPHTPSPNTKVSQLLRNITVPVEIRKKLVFSEALTAQLKNNNRNLKKNSKEREAFQKCVSGNILKENRVQHMANAFLPTRQNNKQKQGKILESNKPKHTYVVTKQIRQKIIEFFEDDGISRMCSGKKDFIVKGKIKKQKRLLTASVKDLHKKFEIETGISLSYQTLLREKPFWVVHPKLRDRETCLCVRHDNMESMLNKLHSLKLIDSKNTADLIQNTSCDTNSYACMFCLCKNCTTKLKLQPTERNYDDIISFFKWKTVVEERIIKGQKKQVKFTKKVLEFSSIKGLIVEVEKEIPLFKKHIYGIHYHNKTKKNLIENMTPNEIVIQVDFAENYVAKYHKETQSMHFGASKTQLSIHTGVYKIKNEENECKTHSFATISGNLDHQAHGVWAHLKIILPKILQENSQVDTIHFYSDGPTSQYRNRTNIYLWTKILQDDFPQIVHSTWNFSEPGHGKGPMDGIGGFLKRAADKHVLRGHDVTTAEDFVNLFAESSTCVMLVPNHTITQMKDLIPIKVPGVLGIMSMTQICWHEQSNNGILLKCNQHGRRHRFVNGTNSSLPTNTAATTDETDNNIDYLWKIQSEKPRLNVYRQIYGTSTSTSEDEEVPSQHLNQEINKDKLKAESSCQAKENIHPNLPSQLQKQNMNEGSPEPGLSYSGNGNGNIHPNMITSGTFVLVEIEEERFKNKIYVYVAVSQGVVEDDGELKVMFLKCMNNTCKDFKIKENDVSYITFAQIKSILPNPQLMMTGDRIYYQFKKAINVFEK